MNFYSIEKSYYWLTMNPLQPHLETGDLKGVFLRMILLSDGIFQIPRQP